MRIILPHLGHRLIWSMSQKHKHKKLMKNSWDLTGLTWKERKGRKYEINRWTRRGKMILKNGEYRPMNDFYFCYIFHVSNIVSFCLRAEKPSLDWSAVERLLRHFAESRRLGVYDIMFFTSNSNSPSPKRYKKLKEELNNVNWNCIT